MRWPPNRGVSVIPNHVSHRIIAIGSDADRFINECFEKGEETNKPIKIEVGQTMPWCFDANKVMPMPAILEGTQSPPPRQGVELLKAERTGDYSYFEQCLDWKWIKDKGVTTPEEAARLFESEKQAALKSVQALLETGYSNWYDWATSSNNWGTKWGSYSGGVMRSPGGYEITFETAWCTFSDRFWETIAKKYPSLILNGSWFDEGWCHAGDIEISNGTCVLNELEANGDTYEFVYGEPPEKEDEE